LTLQPNFSKIIFGLFVVDSFQNALINIVWLF